MDTIKHSGTKDPNVSARELRNQALARKAAAEGIVLLKNDGLLPLKKGSPIALLGGGASQTVRGGTGSGGVNPRYAVSIYEGLEKAGFTITSADWIRDYDIRYQEARDRWKEKILEEEKHVLNPFDAYASNPFRLPEGRRLTTRDLAGAETAVYVISRIAGEGRDRRLEKGDYYLSDTEERDLSFLDSAGVSVILIVNSGGPVELTDVLERGNIRSALFIAQPGQEGGNAVADVLSGDVTPSGKLACTWARRYGDYHPCAKNFGYLNGDLSRDCYEDGIYTGYRWFDASGIEPLFPFGFGLSYTAFSMERLGVKVRRGTAAVSVKVSNTGKLYAGREVVQIYASCPQTKKLPKERNRLVSFQKTKLLLPGEEQIVELEISQKNLASFSEEQHAWILEQGDYTLWLNESVPCGILWVERDTVIQKTSSICPLRETLHETIPSIRPVGMTGHSGEPQTGFPRTPFLPEAEKCEKAETGELEPLARSLPVEKLIPLLCGNIVESSSAFGSAGVRVPGSAGETTQELEQTHGVPSLVMADGPAGVRLKNSYQVDPETDAVYPIPLLGFFEGGALAEERPHKGADTWYQYCTAFPVGTLLAQTWDTELLAEVGAAVSEELEEFGVQLWLAPGMNIQRNPLCGRNFEYYSEDPLLSGSIAAAIVAGTQKSGRAGAVIKHFACNNQEDNRMGVDAVISERALREIYLRGFEIAIETAQPLALMTSYNLVNGVHAANSFDLCTIFARRECAFQGLIMTDWTTTAPEGGSIPWKCAEAGNDLIMPGSVADRESIQNAFSQGFLPETDIRACAGRVLHTIQTLKG